MAGKAAGGKLGALWCLLQGVDFQFNTGAVHRVSPEPVVTRVKSRA